MIYNSIIVCALALRLSSVADELRQSTTLEEKCSPSILTCKPELPGVENDYMLCQVKDDNPFYEASCKEGTNMPIYEAIKPAKDEKIHPLSHAYATVQLTSGQQETENTSYSPIFNPVYRSSGLKPAPSETPQRTTCTEEVSDPRGCFCAQLCDLASNGVVLEMDHLTAAENKEGNLISMPVLNPLYEYETCMQPTDCTVMDAPLPPLVNNPLYEGTSSPEYETIQLTKDTIIDASCLLPPLVNNPPYKDDGNYPSPVYETIKSAKNENSKDT